jgi:putative membrane protein
MTRTIPILLTIAGLAVLTIIVGWLGAGHVMHAILSVGLLGFAEAIAVQLALFLLLAEAWHVACPSIPWRRLLLGRAVREAGTSCLPFAHLGGIAFGMQAITGRGTDHAAAFAASVVDVTTETIGQIAFIALGVAALEAAGGSHRYTLPLLAGLALMAAGVGGFVWLQNDGGRLVRRLFATISRHVAQQWRSMALHGMDAVQDGLEHTYDHKGRLALASTLHLLAWIGGAGWTWLVYRLLGADIGPAAALAIEGAVSGILTVSFLVPGNLGVQEGAYVALGSLFGIPADLSLGLSLLRRAKDLAIGVPALLLWQGLEVRRAREVHAAGAIE